MQLDALFALLTRARELCGHSEYVVIGSLSVLGLAEVAAIPAGMTMSIDVDCYTLADPGRALDLQAELGEGSAWHRRHGIFLDPVNPHLPTLPQGWESRLLRLERGGVAALFLEPHDAAVSKLARGEERDVRWVTTGARAHLLSMATVALRMKHTDYLDDEEQRAAAVLAGTIQRRLASPSAARGKS